MYSDADTVQAEQKERLQPNFIAYFREAMYKRHKNSSTSILVNWKRALDFLKMYAGENLPFFKIDNAFAEEYKRFLLTAPRGGNKCGTISHNTASTYFSIFKAALKQAFIHWAVRNGINKVNEPDDLSKDSAENLIKMFEQIFQSKKNEVFVSMQFGDSQSELIYEKIVRAIEQFNTKYTGIHLNVYPIRIDRTVESSTYSIQDRILEAIKSCSLIIADLSSKNINVYHEIGYAMGVAQANNLLPNMILLYKEDTEYNEGKQDVDKFVGFNLRNLSQLRFKDYKQLVDGLVERLEKHYEV